MKHINYLFHTIQKNSINNKIVFISGESGSGKTTLALQLVNRILSHFASGCCIWIQSSELFPYKRLKSLFQNDLRTLSLLEKNIFVTPNKHTFFSYKEQTEFLINLFSSDTLLPPHLKCMVIDNISHHLRHEIAKYSKIKEITKLFNGFFEEQLFPLICYCQREGIYLLLIHEYSYDPISNRNRVFYHKLYDRINAISMELSINRYKYGRSRRLKIYDQNKINIQSYNFKISKEGLIFE